MQDELTEKMHSEFTIDAEKEKKLRAGCVWNVLGVWKVGHWDRYLGMTAAMTQILVPTAAMMMES